MKMKILKNTEIIHVEMNSGLKTGVDQS